MGKYPSEYDAVRTALKQLQAIFESADKDDWRASLAWDAVEMTLQYFDSAMFDALECPRKPEKFQHWTERFVDDPAMPF
jgi:hypothetical protein